MRTCSIPGCDKPHKAHGWCRAHYTRWQRHGSPTGGGTSNGEPLRYVENVVLPYEGEDCIPWPFSSGTNGYGQLYHNGKTRVASRVVCEMVHGQAPSDEHEAAHSCGNGHLGCVNKRHLSWKTPKENQADREIHGTLVYGDKSPNAKLTAVDVRRIRSLKGKASSATIAAEYSISARSVRNVLNGSRWRRLTRDEVSA